MKQPIVFYDGDCGFCAASVRFILRIDSKKVFLFAPLQGSTAKAELSELLDAEPDLDSLVLVEWDDKQQKKSWVRGQAVLRILYLLGGFWTLIGWMHILPGLPFDLAYRLIAHYRMTFFGQSSDHYCDVPDPETRKRFLP